MRFRPTNDPRSSAGAVIRSLYEITTDYRAGFPDQVGSLLQLGCDRFQMDIGILSRIADGTYEVMHTVVPHSVQLAPGDRFELADTYCSITVDANGPVGFEHAGESSFATHPAYRMFRLEAYIGIPVYNDGAFYGTLNFSSPTARERAFDEADVDSLKLMSSWLEIELYRRDLEAELIEARHHQRQLAHTDPLTELSNRRGIEETLGGLLGRSRRGGGPLTCVLIDIDDFKSVNDTFGHSMGDEVIRGVADGIRACLRPTDAAGRIGGDEFLALLPGVSLEDAEAVANRIAAQVRSMQIRSDDGQVVAPTVSIGVAPAPPTGTTVTDVVAATQGMLRVGKRAGKDTVATMREGASAPPVTPQVVRVGTGSPVSERLPAAG